MKYKYSLLLVLFFYFHNSFAQVNDTAIERLNDYKDKILLIFYKCSSLDDEVSKAINEKRIQDIETGRTALMQCAIDGIHQLASVKSFDGDPSLKFSCNDVLKYYKQLAESDLPQVRDFFLLEQNFFKIQNEFKKKPVKKHSPAEIIAYNSEANKYNYASARYMQLTNFIASGKKLTMYNWNASVKLFMDTHQSKM